MIFSSSILLIPFALFVFAFTIFGFINIFNLVKYGEATFAGVFAIFCFLIATAVVIFLTFNQFSAYNWQEPISLFESASWRTDFLNGNSF